jgi:hypothetical protein
MRGHDGTFEFPVVEIEAGAAIEDARRAGTQSIHFVDSLTNAELVAEAEKSEKRSADALRAAKLES